jgi:hydrogenase expression/formation protein HypD
MHTLLLYWTTIAIAISACCVNPVIGSSSLSKRLNLCRKSSERKRSDYAADYTHRLEVLSEVFEPREYFEWRGLGSIAHSGMKLQQKYSRYDAELKFSVPGLRVADPKACQCGEILKGVKKPWECKVFGTACTPETPIGSCMVSSEGACAAYYNFGRLSKIAERSAVSS